MTASPSRRHAFVAALQWGLVQAFLLDSLGRFLRNYYRATTEAFFAPGWVTSIQFAAPLGLLVGGYGGYRWMTSGRGSISHAAHRRRVVFVGALLAGWALAIVPTLAFDVALGDRLFTVPYFALPSLVSVLVLGGAYALAYRVDPGWYARRRNRLLGAVQGALCGLLVGLAGFVLYGQYLAATRDTYALDGSLGTVVSVVLGAAAGVALVDTDERGERAAEFVTVLLLSGLTLPLLAALVLAALNAVGLLAGFGTPYLYPLLPLVASFGLSVYATYGARTHLSRRLVARD
ncbi:hypothetical protein C2R22_18405 [Salinigranum rubrum]|uniref:Uncharacterized protein n=1 Tax=Salinigranum rubrum TaxID=755307 RepID=A0A2I8VN57_9EURY|nr:hypothetical protein [Salinigranum rubrum]AUV83372.1 hypothetical protein C2R22_18405 [Salinigranum rubrum]